MYTELSFVGGFPFPRKASRYRIGYTQRGKPYSKQNHIIMHQSKGVKTWGVFENEKQEKSWYPVKKHQHFYFTHDNGGRPFMVVYNCKQKNARIFKVPENKANHSYENPECYTQKVVEFKDIQKLFVGKDQGELWDFDGKPVQFADGNSILLRMKQGQYIFIGDCIYSFYSEDPIQIFFSTVGNNDVPYAGALTWNHYYSMIEKRKIPLDAFPKDTEWGNADYYMYHKMNDYKQYPTLPQLNMIVNRSW